MGVPLNVSDTIQPGASNLGQNLRTMSTLPSSSFSRSLAMNTLACQSGTTSSPEAAAALLEQAERLQDCGVFAMVIECVPQSLAAEITRRLTIPTIGIGAGGDCDGQVLVVTDLLGLDAQFKPRFARRYLDGASLITSALDQYARDVKSGGFPAAPETVA